MIEERQKFSSVVGREEVLNRLRQRLEALKKGYRQNVSLVGPPFIGKTSFLRELLQRVGRDSELIPVYIPLGPLEFDDFVARWLGALLQGFLNFRNIPLPAEFQLLVKTSRAFIPKTLERMREVKKHAFQKRIVVAFRELLNVTATLAEETGRKVLLILDEFQWLGRLEIPDPFGVLGKEIMIQKDTLYLVTSSEPAKAREIFNNRLSLLFGNFEVIELGPLGSKAIASWVKGRFPEMEIPDSDIRLLNHLLDNHPYYVDLFLESARMFSLRTRQSSWSREFFLKAFAEMIFSDRGVLNRHFQSAIQNLILLGRSTTSYLKILTALANGRSKLLPIAAYSGKKTGETKKLLQRLVGEGMVEKKGSFYRLPDPLFRFWLRNVYQIKEKEPDLEGARTRLRFEARLAEEVRKIEEEDKSDLTQRLESLFHQFRNDVVEINGKKVRCPTFLEIATRPTNGRYFPLLARFSEGRWFCQVFQELVTEGDVASFVEELKHFRKEIQRKIMVVLSGIELNAKLMAQEAKIQVWDLENFNTLLDFYGRLKVIL